MDNELIELSRDAMALDGAPDVSFITIRNAGDYPVHYEVSASEYIWNLRNTSRTGDALGGVLFGALREYRVCVHGFSHYFSFNVNGAIGRCKTLSEACCRVAVALGRWPGVA